ncbi:hypothetical protein LCGC14_2263080 [marine sediment metagenome]|uniref:Uncharacterized protein n=1 Tax=marine sediment metagenome TaxID=412755 RepID=A0A0F9CZ45_9ZZZZ
MMYVAVFMQKGVLEELEVYTDRVEAEKQADEWRKKSTPDEDVVDVLEREPHIDISRRYPALFRD